MVGKNLCLCSKRLCCHVGGRCVLRAHRLLPRKPITVSPVNTTTNYSGETMSTIPCRSRAAGGKVDVSGIYKYHSKATNRLVGHCGALWDLPVDWYYGLGVWHRHASGTLLRAALLSTARMAYERVPEVRALEQHATSFGHRVPSGTMATAIRSTWCTVAAMAATSYSWSVSQLGSWTVSAEPKLARCSSSAPRTKRVGQGSRSRQYDSAYAGSAAAGSWFPAAGWSWWACEC